MRIDVVTLFPEMFGVVRDLGVTGRAHAQGRWALHAWNPRDFTSDPHRTVDDRPYGGGPGMVMMAAPLEAAVNAAQAARAAQGLGPAPVALLAPVGKRYDQAGAEALAASDGLILICGRYEGVDQRFIERCVTHEISLGDFVLSGGEIAALAVIDAAVRLLPGVLNDGDSALQDSFNDTLSGLLDSPHYTRRSLRGRARAGAAAQRPPCQHLALAPGTLAGIDRCAASRADRIGPRPGLAVAGRRALPGRAGRRAVAAAARQAPPRIQTQGFLSRPAHLPASRQAANPALRSGAR